ncbi:hypothetical protein [Thiovibrio frasassiensis]|uniref:Uncharacterized protein n=1 Tax=Thiovibrio frasassiensis TaxID=2984131 RepID=A0A9X4RKZ3_9BACT|nr:hypothetical protein [Thiovibrio frasassiensis]MDG4475055.1 hypothetical protein [Thiovibrio frasassiensis]
MMATQPCFSLHEFYGGTIRERLGIAQGLYPDLARELVAKEAFGCQLAQALISQKELTRVMADLDLGGLCGVCGAKPGGGCCSSFMAGENDVVQLLLNLLAGVAVRVFREDAECCFLGELGCPLLFKPMFCLNYNCQQIIRGAGPVRMRHLEQSVGRLLQQQYGLEQLLLEFLRQRGTLRG